MYSGDKNLGQNIIPLEVVSFGRIVVHEASLTQHYLKELYERLPELLAYLEGEHICCIFGDHQHLLGTVLLGGKCAYQTKEIKRFSFPSIYWCLPQFFVVCFPPAPALPRLFISLTSKALLPFPSSCPKETPIAPTLFIYPIWNTNFYLRFHKELSEHQNPHLLVLLDHK